MSTRSKRDRAIEAAARGLMDSHIDYHNEFHYALVDALELPILPPTPSSSPTPQWIRAAWNKTCASKGMKPVRVLSTPRKAKMAASIRAADATEAEWTRALQACSQDRFWLGDTGWRGNLQSFLRPEHRERFLDEAAEPDFATREAPQRKAPAGYSSLDAYYSHLAMTSADGESFEQVKARIEGTIQP